MTRRGTVLIAVMVVTALAALMAAGILFRMRAEVKASAVAGRGEQAYAAAQSGMARAIAVLRAHAAESDVWYDNPDLFYNQLIGTEGTDRWYFTVWAESSSDQALPRYGVTDESSKININEADMETLLKMPNMTAELAAALIDYRDGDSDPLPQGAEQDYYGQLKRPYLIRNGPFATLEELLFVKGFDGTIVYGEDANLNGLLDPNEDDGDKTFPPDDADGRLNTGLRGVATALSREPKVDPADQARLDLNGDLKGLEDVGLPDQTVQFIKLYRAEGNSFKHASELLEAKYELKQAPKDVPDLAAGDTIESGVGANELPLVLEKLTVRTTGSTTPAPSGSTTPAPSGSRRPRGGRSTGGAGREGATPGADQPPAGEGPGGSPGEEGPVADTPTGSAAKPAVGHVNLNTASATVLALLPGIDEGLANQIVDVRRGLEPEAKSNIAWLYTRNLVDADAFKKIAPLVGTRGYQFHVMSVGFGVPCGRYRVLEAVVDLADGNPRVAYWRDVTRLGMPFALSADLQEAR